MTKVTPFLMFNDQLEAAIAFYTTTFPDSEIRNIARTGTDGPITSAEFVIGGQFFMGYNGGAYFKFSEGVSGRRGRAGPPIGFVRVGPTSTITGMRSRTHGLPFEYPPAPREPAPNASKSPAPRPVALWSTCDAP